MAILVSTPQDLDNIRNNLSGSYELTQDLDMSNFGNFVPLGDISNRFTGNINGKGYKIINLSITQNAQYTGFIGVTNGGSISNLGLENVYVEGNDHHTAGLMGLNYMTTVSNCYVTGTIKQTDTSKIYTGGLVGRSYGLIENCFTDCNVIGGTQTGGFVGYITNQTGIFKNNYVKGRVSGTTNTGAFYGGFNDKSGYRATFENNFFDKDIVGTTDYQTTGVTAKSTSEMQTQSTFTGYDFDNVWYMEDYPRLRVFANIPTAKKETITVESYVNTVVGKSRKHIKSTKQLQSYTDTILSDSKRHTATIRQLESYLSQINSEATQSHRSVKTGNRNVDSFIYPIGTSIYRESKTIKQLLSYVDQLRANINVIYPITNQGVNAYCEVVHNPSSILKLENNTYSEAIQNPSSVEVIT